MPRTEQHDLLAIARRVFGIEAQALTHVAGKLDKGFLKAIEIISNAPGRVVVSGMGKSGLVGKKIAATLASTGTPAFFVHPAEACHGDLGMITERDVIIAISNSGETEEILRLIPFFKRFRVPLIAMTGNPASPLAMAADVHIDVGVCEEACPLGIVPTASTTATLAMGDAVAVALVSKRGFREEDFARYHPGGALGRKLFITVGDLMQTGDTLPLITPGTAMIKAVVEISSKRLGLAIVTDDRETVLGIVTDGDIRRGIERWGSAFFEMAAGEVMTKAPKTIAAEELAAKALAVMEEKKITALIVPDPSGKALGVIHLHDILRKGIV
ncbi:MAG TPA: KpsF/GutQ family sugar-phosphate isomerase [Dissulfurispiraceae bacterium]|nr:KpsF/GutQ family sugar-phosphate isomerase [Dissulfurispiraceae bacterium]